MMLITLECVTANCCLLHFLSAYLSTAVQLCFRLDGWLAALYITAGCISQLQCVEVELGVKRILFKFYNIWTLASRCVDIVDLLVSSACGSSCRSLELLLDAGVRTAASPIHPIEEFNAQCNDENDECCISC